MVCACHTDHSPIFGDHHGVLIVKSGAFIHLQQWFQVAYRTIVQSNQFSYNLLDNSQSVEISEKLPT
jgi:hypothetical protein